MKNLSIIVSSTRPQRVAGHVTRWAAEQLGADWNVTILDLAEINLPFLDEDQMAGTGVYEKPHTLAWKSMIDAADALVFINAEYNGFPPAPVLNAIDFLFAEWESKPAAIVGYGFGGGQRSATALTQKLTNVKANVVGSTGLFFNQDLTMDGQMTVGDEKVDELRARSAELASALQASAAA